MRQTMERVRVRLRPWWGMVRDLVLLPLRPPTSTRQNRLGRQTIHEVMIYLGEDNTIYVQHLAMQGKGQAEVAIRMCWEAMQHLAMSSNLGLNLPQQAATPVQVYAQEPPAEAVAAHSENGSH